MDYEDSNFSMSIEVFLFSSFLLQNEKVVSAKKLSEFVF